MKANLQAIIVALGAAAFLLMCAIAIALIGGY